MTAATLRVACCGAGYFSQFHYGSWARFADVDVVGACDRDLSRARATGRPAFDDLDAMLGATAPDIVDLVLPPAAQAEAVATALAHRPRAIICQKPFGQDMAEARRLTAAAEAAGIPLVIHENFRFQPWYRAIARALAEGRIGTPLQAVFRLRPGDGQGPRAYLDRQPYFRDMPRFLVHETGVHWVDVFRFLLGDVVAVYADLRRINPVIAGEDAGHVLMEHESGARSLLDANRALDHAADNRRRTMGEALVEGTGGALALTGDGAVTLRAFGQDSAALLLPPDTWEGFGGDCVHALNAHVLAHLRHGAPLENEARDYLRVLEIEAAIYASAESGRRVALSGG